MLFYGLHSCGIGTTPDNNSWNGDDKYDDLTKKKKDERKKKTEDTFWGSLYCVGMIMGVVLCQRFVLL